MIKRPCDEMEEVDELGAVTLVLPPADLLMASEGGPSALADPRSQGPGGPWKTGPGQCEVSSCYL